jgi:hypothetical protein
VQYIDNQKLAKLYAATKKQIELEIRKPSEELRLYHGTPHAPKIAKEGFDINLSQSKNNMLGKGMCSIFLKINNFQRKYNYNKVRYKLSSMLV